MAKPQSKREWQAMMNTTVSSKSIQLLKKIVRRVSRRFNKQIHPWEKED